MFLRKRERAFRRATTIDRELAFLFVGRRSFVRVPSFGEERACKQSQTAPDSEFPPESFSFDQFEVERISHRFAGRFGFYDGTFIAAMKLFRQLLILGRHMKFARRSGGQARASLSLCVECSLNLYFGQGARRRPLERCSDHHTGESNPKAEHCVRQESMQTHALPLRQLNSREVILTSFLPNISDTWYLCAAIVIAVE